jgi:hypothetical protein
MGSTIGNTLTKITDYNALIQSKILEQYKGKVNWNKLFEVISEEFNNIENMFWDLYIKRWLDSSEGKQLDNLGYNLSVERQGLDDADFRQIIHGKIGQYNSNGRINDIIGVIKLMTNADFILVTELFPAKLSIAIIGDSLNLNADFLEESIKGSVAGGVGIDIIISGNIPVFVYAPEDGSMLTPEFSGYPAEDASTVSYYAETV